MWACSTVAAGLLAVCLPLRLSQATFAFVPAVFEPCLAKGEQRGQEVALGPDVHVWSWEVDDVRPCLDSIKVDLHTMILTLENLFFGVSSIYSFTAIATDAAASMQKNKCELGVHDVKVDLYKELAAAWDEFVIPSAREAGAMEASNLTAEQIFEVLYSRTAVSSLEFHSRLNALFARLEDAHTTYNLWTFGGDFVQVLPVEFSLQASGPDELQPEVFARRLVPGESPNQFRQVATIDGEPPLVFLQQIADRKGLYHDEGQRLNDLLLSRGNQLEEGLTLRLGVECSLVLPGKGAVRLTFSDGGVTETNWRVSLIPSEVEYMLTLSNPNYQPFWEMEANKFSLREQLLQECESIPGCSQVIAEGLMHPVAIEQHALRAYKHLFGESLPDATLRQVAEYGAHKAMARRKWAPLNERSATISGYAELRRSDATGGETLTDSSSSSSSSSSSGGSSIISAHLRGAARIVDVFDAGEESMPQPAIEATPETSPASTVCQDIEGWATNVYNYTCWIYEFYPSGCSLFDDSDFTAADMCCACQHCTDSAVSTVDSDGVGCSWYESRPDACSDYDDSDFSAGNMCCACLDSVLDCTDSAGGAVDNTNFGCWAYEHVPSACSLFDDSDFSASDMCCACQLCTDSAGSAVDSVGDGCSWYESFPSGCSVYDDSDFIAADMCCACFGIGVGDSTQACNDTAGVAMDTYNDSCSWYEGNPSSCSHFDDSDFSAGDMCCACQLCTDSAGTAVDTGGDGCPWYVLFPGVCSVYDDSDFSSGLMCCACSEPASSPNTTGEHIQSCLAGAANLTNVSVEVLFSASPNDWMVVMAVDDMVVIKMANMASNWEDIGVAMTGYRIAVDFARQNEVRRLLLDLVGNGGGYVFLSDMLQSLLLKNYDASELCEDYNKKVNEYWRQWILSFGTGIEAAVEGFIQDFVQRASTIPLQVGKWLARWHLGNLQIIMTASNEILEHSSFDLSKIDRWTKRVDETTAMGDLVRFMEEIMRRQEFVPEGLYTDAEGMEHGRSGWFPFLGDEILDRSTLQPFPNMSGLLEPVRQRWGDGRESGQSFSQKGLLMGCPMAAASDSNLQQNSLNFGFPDLREHKDHPFADIAVLTDGLAGSAGSAITTKLMASGYAAVFTYGGNGKAMDSSAFAGGNVLDYDGWQSQVAIAAELGMWLVPNSLWERLSRNMSLTSDLSVSESVIYPWPMPSISASARFNFNMYYVREFGVDGDNSQLPRQFYRMPAHKHFNVWPRKLFKACDNPTGILDMYSRIQKEDWWQVRLSPQFLNAGWSSTCVPDATRMECCEVRPSPQHEL